MRRSMFAHWSLVCFSSASSIWVVVFWCVSSTPMLPCLLKSSLPLSIYLSAFCSSRSGTLELMVSALPHLSLSSQCISSWLYTLTVSPILKKRCFFLQGTHLSVGVSILKLESPRSLCYVMRAGQSLFWEYSLVWSVSMIRQLIQWCQDYSLYNFRCL